MGILQIEEFIILKALVKKALLITSASSFGTSLCLFLLDSFFFHSYVLFPYLFLAAANAEEIN